jgi:carbon-monoxide dehydrogenase small subunit
MEFPLEFSVNEQPVQLTIEPHLTLLEVLRESLALTSVKEGCGTGDCGACTVLLDGEPVNACLVLAAEVEGRQVTTVEGLATNGMHPLQKALVAHGGLQCGFCTPGVLLSSVALLAHDPRPSADEIREALAGNLCRCTGYDKIVRAVQAAAEEMAHV